MGWAVLASAGRAEDQPVHRSAGRTSWRAPAAVAVAVTAVALVTLPWRAVQLSGTTSFVPAMLAVLVLVDLLSGYLLVREFNDTGDRRPLAMALAYAWSLVVMLGYAGAFPGVLSSVPPLATAPSVAPWLYVLWHAGFPVALGLAWAPWPRPLDTACPPHRRGRTAAAALGGMTVLAGAVVGLVVGAGMGLPVLIEGLDTSHMSRLTAPVALPLVTGALLLTAWGLRRRQGPERWTVVAVLTCLADLVLTYSSYFRFSVGWYVGRSLTVIAGTVILLAMLHEFASLQARLRRQVAETAELARLHQHVVDNLSEGVTLQDDAGLITANPAALALLRVDQEGLAGSSFDVVHADGTPWPRADRPSLHTLRTGEPHRDVLMGLCRPGGDVVWLSVNTTRIGHDRGSSHQVIASFTDVTERERSRRALEASRDQALGAVAAKSEFLANVSHEIRTPLNGVLGLNDLLLATDLDEHQRRLATTSQQCGQALLALLNDVLDFSKVEAGRLELEAVPFALRSTLSAALQLVTASAAAKGLEVSLSVDDDVPEHVIGDALRLRQVLANLMSNAVKFTDDGSVQVDVRREPGGAPGRLRVTVTDTGVGVGAQADTLFEPYRQADTTVARTKGGTGLGLSIVRQLVGLMGGSVGVEPAPGRGSRFWFVVELRTGVAAKVPRQAGHGELGPLAGRVLIAEDNAVNAMVAELLLASWGLDVTCVADGQAAVHAVAASAFDIVLMDAQMPVMDGVAATRALRAAHGDDGPAVIALSAGARTEDREAFARAGAVGYLTKPLLPAQVHAALAAVLRARVHAR